jgi:hypothetical protein
MAHPIRKRKCPYCKTFFHPDHRNVTRQRYCSKPDCRQASKVDSQHRWWHKPETATTSKALSMSSASGSGAGSTLAIGAGRPRRPLRHPMRYKRP